MSARHASASTSRPRDGVHAPVRSDTFGETLFRGILARERRRTDRSNQRFLLVTLWLKDGQSDGSSRVLARVLDVLATTKRDTDIVGWLERDRRIGLILSDIQASDPTSAYDGLEAHLRREVSNGVDADTLHTLSIEFHPYPEAKRVAESNRWPADPILYPDLEPGPAPAVRYEVLKRVLDVTVSVTLLIVLSPLLLLIAALVRLGSRGPVLFRQVRVGRMAEPFTMVKFRTMHTGADHKVHQDYVTAFIKANDQVNDSAKNGVFKLTNDRRVTQVGRLLRKTSLDELPQLWNVLRGDMSLVGPRPPLPYELEQYEPWHRCRVLEARPGITGLWQVTGRSRTTFDEMVRLDLRYARTRSFRTDIKILLATPAAVLSGKGAG
jgi:lipopolysaccharide/colanic/teichoic acid biosynthesis glycosyltransferase